MILSSAGLRLTRRTVSFHTLGRSVENVCSLGRVLRAWVRAVMGARVGEGAEGRELVVEEGFG